jgi:flagellar assembly protein FliH
MTISHLLEDFAPSQSTIADTEIENIQNVISEEARLEAFELGYSAGWEDSATARSEAHTHLSDELCEQLRSLSFTYHEALGQMTKNLRPALNLLFKNILPKTMSVTLGPRLAEEFTNIGQKSAATPVVISVPKGAGASVLALLSRDHQMPVNVQEDENLSLGEARLGIDDTVYGLDGNEVLETIEETLAAYLDLTEMEPPHARQL